MEQLRVTVTSLGPITYALTRKRVKNWNLRVRNGQVILGVPLWVGEKQADDFICSRAEWILRAVERQNSAPDALVLPRLPHEECLRRLTEALERVLPLTEPLGVSRPELRLRAMRSQWGNCHFRQGYITLNTALASCPEALQDYVALHELVHFLHPDHGPGFRAVMDRLMPDWKTRRKQLKRYRLE